MLDKLKLRFVMTSIPYHVQAEDSVAKIRQEFHAHNVRHLPVLKDQEVIGMVSERDVSLALALVKHVGEEDDLTAADICTPDPYAVDIEERFDTVLTYMGKNRIGSAVVMENGQMAGIITTTDICIVCGDIFKKLFDEGTLSD